MLFVIKTNKSTTKTERKVLPHSYKRPTMLYKTKCQAIKNLQENWVAPIVEMRLLQWMTRHTRQHRIRNECIRKKIGVAPILKKMVESHHRCFEHAWKRPLKAPVRRLDQIEDSPITRGRGRPRKIIGETIKRDLYVNCLNVNIIYDDTIVSSYPCSQGPLVRQGLVVVVLAINYY